jgi:hypothetical protein
MHAPVRLARARTSPSRVAKVALPAHVRSLCGADCVDYELVGSVASLILFVVRLESNLLLFSIFSSPYQSQSESKSLSTQMI